MIKVDVSLDELDRSIRGMLRHAANLTPAWKDARKPILEDQKRHAREQAGPDGPWAARSPFTIARMRARGSRRRPLGKLPRAVQVDMAPRSVRVKSRSRFSKAHQPDGAGTTRVGRGSVLPARPFLWASRQLLETVATIIAKRLGLNWPRG